MALRGPDMSQKLCEELCMIVVRRKHGFGLARAKRLAEQMARRLRAEYGGAYEWDGNDLRFMRTGASGVVSVTKDDVDIRVELSLLLTRLRAQIEREIRAFCDEQFGANERADRRARASPATPRGGAKVPARSRPSAHPSD